MQWVNLVTEDARRGTVLELEPQEEEEVREFEPRVPDRFLNPGEVASPCGDEPGEWDSSSRPIPGVLCARDPDEDDEPEDEDDFDYLYDDDDDDLDDDLDEDAEEDDDF